MKRSKFSLSYYRLLTGYMGQLIPCGVTEVLPGDTIQHATSMLLRCSPMLAPVMHPVHIRIHHWFVPHRLVWEDWEDFITAGEDGLNASVFPTVTLPGEVGVGGLADHLGIPPYGGLEVSALPFRGYNLIWNEWYRDQDLQDEQEVSLESGPDTTTPQNLLHCAWEKDYFTSARPWEQKGPSITIPLGTEAPVKGLGKGSAVFGGPFGPVRESDETTPTYASGTLIDPGNPDTAYFVQGKTGNWPNVRADLSNASAITINRLREAFALQRYEEARARYGSRYVEYLRYLGVRSSDARLQRPEYLGGGKQTIQFSEVIQTAEGTAPVGEMRGHGIGAMRSNRYRRFFEEHGYIYSLLSIKPKTMYTQGIPRTYNRRTKEDFWQQELQHIGQQEILNKEVYAFSGPGDETFGFQDRYDEYRRSISTVSGDFRTSELDYWHMARIFAEAPALNASFIAANPTNRIFADQVSDNVYVMANHSIQARRLVAQTGHSFIF